VELGRKGSEREGSSKVNVCLWLTKEAAGEKLRKLKVAV
jgi:hypothetical protein